MSRKSSEASNGLSGFEQSVLDAWAETHKKSAVMLFILLAVRNEPSWSADIRRFIADLTDGALAVDEQSLHRALRRIEGLNMITHTEARVAGTGARRKVYELTVSGEKVLAAFLRGPMAYAASPAFLDAARQAEGRA